MIYSLTFDIVYYVVNDVNALKTDCICGVCLADSSCLIEMLNNKAADFNFVLPWDYSKRKITDDSPKNHFLALTGLVAEDPFIAPE